MYVVPIPVTEYRLCLNGYSELDEPRLRSLSQGADTDYMDKYGCLGFGVGGGTVEDLRIAWGSCSLR